MIYFMYVVFVFLCKFIYFIKPVDSYWETDVLYYYKRTIS